MHDQSEGPIILAAFANDRSDAANFLRNLSVEAQRMQAVLEPARQLCPLVLLPNATLDEILDAFQKYRDRVVVFHYAGHANGFELLLESATGGVHRIGAQGLAAFLGQQQGLQLVFLNGCSTEGQAEDLLNAGVGCVIATTQSIDDGVATEFSARFYQGIVTGAPLQSAYAEATGSAQAASGGSIDRLIRRKEEQAPPLVASRWPWLLKFKPGAERVAQWSLPEAAGDPLFGLPPVAQRDLPESPYRHLYRFEAEHAEVFFGRGHEIRELYQRVTASDAAPVVLFYGPSGVGKSSLLDAGLIPRLAGKNEVRYARRDPALGLGETLRSVFPKDVRQLSRRDAWIAAEKQLGRPLVIVLDQVEEVFTKPNASQPHELAEFAQLLRRIFSAPDHRPQGKLILGFRKEWFAEIDELLADAQVSRSRIFLERLSRDGVIEVITGPVDDVRLASQYRLRIEDGLAEVIADDLHADPDTPVAPTLQILLTRMWSEACRINREQPTFDAELYQSLHRDGILLDDFLRQQTNQIRERLPRAVESGFLLDLLEFHTTAIGTSAEHPLPVLEAMYTEQAKSGLLSQTLALCEELYLLTFSGTVGVSTLGSSGPLSPAIDRASGKDLNTGERARVRGPAAPAQPPHPGPLPPSHVQSEPIVARGGEGAESHRSSRLLHDTLAPLIRARHEGSDLPGQRSRRILDNRMVDWLEGKTGIPLDAKDLKEVEAALEGTRSWSPDEQRLVTASREQRSSNRRWSRIFKGLGLAAVLGIAATGALAYWQSGETRKANAALTTEKEKLEKSNRDLSLKTKEAVDAQLLAEEESVKATTAKRETREMLASNRFVSAATARDAEHDLLKSAHLYAAAAEASDDPGRPAGKLPEVPPQSTVWSFAAGHSMGDARLIDTLTHKNQPVHEAWLLKSGEIAVWWGPLTSCELTLWGPEGIKHSISLDGVPRVVLSADESLLIVELPDGSFQSVDTKTWNLNAYSTTRDDKYKGLVEEVLPTPVLYRSDVTAQLSVEGLSFLEEAIQSLHGTPIYGIDLSADSSRILVWTAKYVHPPTGAVGVVNNHPGVVQVWDNLARCPITPPLTIGAELRGAKLVANDQQVLMWGENGRVLLWDLSQCHRISDVQISQDPHPRPQEAAYQDGKSWAPMPRDNTQVFWDETGWGIESREPQIQVGEHHNLRGIREMGPADEEGWWVLGWGGSSGATGTGSGGFAGIWHPETGEMFLPLYKHSHAVCSAQSNMNRDLLLTSTYVSEPGDPSPASVHLWSMSTDTELIPPIPVFNNTGAYSEIDSEGRTLTIRTQSGANSRDENLHYITYHLDLTPDPAISTDDPRLDVVIRTGTYLDRFGSVAYLSRESWKELRDNPVRPSYETWFQDLNNPPLRP